MADNVITRGSVVLVRYPFTDLSGSKVRPAILLTPDTLLNRIGDVLCLFISSVMPADLLPTDFILDTNHPAFSGTGLKYRSIFRTHKLALLEKSLVARTLGKVNDELMEEINQRLRIAIGL